MRSGTLVVRAGRADPAPGSPLSPGPVFAATFHSPGDPASSAFTYGRFHNPTSSAYEAALTVLEGGDAVIFASGMAAVAVDNTTATVLGQSPLALGADDLLEDLEQALRAAGC